ncbi:universal stress protein [Roseiconus nitratireducens]|nr:universal stress protein [Roseiconus nitratireducens]
MFEKSQVGPSAALTPIQPSRVLLVLDGSDQDETGIQTAATLRERFNVETLLLDAREAHRVGEDGLQHDPAILDDLTTPVVNRVSGSRPIERADGDAYEAILIALATHAVDLLVVPCPFGRDFEKVGTGSAGTVIDVLLSRCPCPMLVVRRSDQPLGACTHLVSVVVGAECDVENKAAAWAFGLSDESATVTLNLVVEKEQYENIRSIVEALSPDAKLDSASFAEAMTKTHQTLHGTMAKTASELGKTYHLRPQAGEVAPPNPLQNRDKMLVVLPLEVDDRYGQGFVQDRIRRSPHPVLVVPSHVPE